MVSHHSFNSIALDREMQGSGSSIGAISCLSVEKSQVTGLANRSTSIIKYVSANQYNLIIIFSRRKGLVAKQGDIRSVGGDMMALVAGSPQNGKGDVG
jgi:hypothetical protein